MTAITPDEFDSMRRALAQARFELAVSRRALAEAERAAGRDALTGLPNRRDFDAHAARTLADHADAGRPLALLFVDLDGFKKVNDRLGHAVGDRLLRIVGARLSHGVRAGDFVCRHGGDEFLCLLPDVGSADRARAIAQKLACAVSAPCRLGPRTVVAVRASIGVATYPHDGRSVRTLLRRADAAMYDAKALDCGVRMATAMSVDGRSSDASCSTM